MSKVINSFVFFVLLVIAPNAYTACTLSMPVNGTIGPATSDFISRGFLAAKKRNCTSILLLINTPGGSLQSTRLIVEEVLASPVPVLCLVFPQGGHAGSAGAIILQACHVSGAVEATNIGAATPISSTGQEMPEDLRKKLINDNTAWVESLAELRGRNKNFARDIVTEAKSLESKQAFEEKAIDLLAHDVNQFLHLANGRAVQLAKGSIHEVVTGAVVLFDADTRMRILEFAADPEFAYLIFMGSLGLLYFEVTHPGMILPGVLGGIGLIVSLVSFHKLNVDWAGVLLIVLGLALMLAEAFVPSFGALGIGGTASFIFGSLLLFKQNSQDLRLSLGFVLLPSLILGGISLFLGKMAFKSFTRKRPTTNELYREKIATVSEVFSEGMTDGGHGFIEVSGETWKYQCSEKLKIGDKVEIIDKVGLTFKVIRKS